MTVKLTSDQRRQVVATCDTLVTAALSTQPIDRAASIEVINRCYRHLGLEEPQVVFVDSPGAAFAELQKWVTTGATTPSAAATGALAELLKTLPEDVAAMMLAAQPRDVAALGEEVYLDFNHELQEAAADYASPLREPISRLIDKQLGHLVHYKNAVQHSLAEQAAADDRWLIYSSGAASIWDAAEAIARVQSLHGAGATKTLPDELGLALATLQSCGYVNAFEKLCVVTDRPREMVQSGSERSETGLCTTLHWRDGSSSELVFR